MSVALATPLPAINDDEIVAAFRQFESTLARGRDARRDLRTHRERAARLLAAKHQALALNGDFKAWLEFKHIPRASAYRLLATLQPAKPKQIKPLPCLTETRPQVTSLLQITALTLTLQLTPEESAALLHAQQRHPDPNAWALELKSRLISAAAALATTPPPDAPKPSSNKQLNCANGTVPPRPVIYYF